MPFVDLGIRMWRALSSISTAAQFNPSHIQWKSSRIPILNRVCSPSKRRRGCSILELLYLPVSANANCESRNLSADDRVKSSPHGPYMGGLEQGSSTWCRVGDIFYFVLACVLGDQYPLRQVFYM
jgi:hypothetical protein